MFKSLVKEWGIPPLYAQEEAADPKVYMEITLFGFSWRWFVLEAEIEPNDILFYGYVTGLENESGYFRASEIISSNRPIIPQRFDPPIPLSKIKQKYH